MKTTVNGKNLDCQPRGNESAIEVIRDRIGLTGTKLVCGAGVCGACTVLVDGVPMTSCLLPAHSMEGKSIRTVEAFPTEDLHSVQKAFMAHDGLQCGFCTPGFIIETIAFYERWRKEHGRKKPSRDEIALAMSGHLCRCGAYVGIYKAIESAIAGDFDDVAQPDHPRVEAIDKVTGRAKYTADVQLPQMMVGRIIGSRYANAKISNVDTSAAESVEGVGAVVDVLEDIHRVARYVGQPVVAIAAKDEETAHEAMKKVVIHYEQRPFVVGLDQALAPEAPVVYPEKKKKPLNASEGPVPPARWRGNLRVPFINFFFSIGKGKARRRVKAAEQARGYQVVRNLYRTSGQTHTALEPHCAVADWKDGHLTLYSSTQTIAPIANAIAKRYKIPRDRITVHSEFVGGAFGSKQDLTTETKIAIELSRKAKVPVKVMYERTEEMVLGGYRPFTRSDFAVAADDKKELSAMVGQFYGDSGVAVQSQCAPWVRFAYGGIPKSLQDFDVTTNAPGARPFRAPSGPAAFWALESSVDELALKLNLDPVEARKKWDKNKIRGHLYDWISHIPEWQNRGPAGGSNGRFRKGVGVAIGNWFNVYYKKTRIDLSTSADGLVAEMAAQDMGNGLRSVIARAVAEELGISPLDVEVRIGNSNYVEGPISTGSRATNSVYTPSVDAAKKLKVKLLKSIGSLGFKNPRWESGGVVHEEGRMTAAEVFKLTPPAKATAKRGDNGLTDLLGKLPPGVFAMNLIPKWTVSAYMAEVIVDTWLGVVKVRKFWAGIGSGKIVNPELARSQIYGAVIQGMGYALYEDRMSDPTTGALLTIGLEDYRIPGIADTPEVEVYFHEGGFENVKGNACGLSELATLAVAPAIGNAIRHATGWRPTEIPIRPDRVLEGLASRHNNR